MSKLKVIWNGRNESNFCITQGEDLDVTGNVIDTATGLPLDLSGFSTVTASFTDKDSTDTAPLPPVVVTGTIAAGALGEFTLPFTDTESAQFAGGAQDLLIEFTDGATLNRLIAAVKAVFVTVSSVA